MINSALTRWLRQGLTMGMCPLCRVRHKLDREFIWFFFDEYGSQGAAIDELVAAHGFCAEHAEQLRRTEVDALGSTLGISQMYLEVLERLVRTVEALAAHDRSFTKTACPACARRDAGVRDHVRYLVTDLGESERTRERLRAGAGLCLPHLELVLAAAAPKQRALVLDVQTRALGAVIAALRAHVDDPSVEPDAWARAIKLTAGWPPPTAPAGVPERPSG